MPDAKITALTAISTVDPAVDPLPIVDVSDTAMAASGTTKKITINQILGCSGTATLASATITGDLTVDTSTFYVSSSTDKVGIGTTSLSGEKLTVAGNVSANAWIGRTNISAPTADVAIYRAADNTFAISTANTERLRVDVSGNLGLGVTPSAWAIYKSFDLPAQGYISSGNNWMAVMQNAYLDGSYKYKGNGFSSYYLQQNSVHSWYTAASGTAGNAITFTQAMTLDESGNLCVGTTSASARLHLAVADAAEGARFAASTAMLRIHPYLNATDKTRIQAVNGTNTALSDLTLEGLNVRINTNVGLAAFFDNLGNMILQPASTPATLTTNGQLTVNATSNTNLRFSYRGSDGVTRVANITLA